MTTHIDRRLFLHSTLATTAAFAVGAAPAAEAKPKLKKAVKYGMIKIKGSIQEKFELIKSLGFLGVEMDSPSNIDKDEARERWGEEQVHLWQRSYDIAPPGGESLKDTAARALPFYSKRIIPELKAGKTVIVVGWNELRTPPRADNTIRLLDAETGNERRQIDLGNRPSGDLYPSPGGRSVQVLLTYETTLRRFDLATGTETTPAREGHRGIVSELALAPDGKLVSAGYDGSVQVWLVKKSTYASLEDLDRGRAGAKKGGRKK